MKRILFFWVSLVFSFDPVSLVDSANVQIDTIVIECKNTFDDAKINTSFEKWVYNLGNSLRFKTRSSVIEKLLLFKAGETISKTDLLESERNIRQQPFIAEASITIFKKDDGTHLAKVVTNDKWTTAVIASVQKPEDWVYAFGLVEYDFLGLGYEAGAVFSKQLEREVMTYSFRNPNFIFNNNRLKFSYLQNFKDFDLTSGYEYIAKLYRPFVSINTSWAYTVEGLYSEQPNYYYLSRTQTPAQVFLKPNASTTYTESDLTSQAVVTHELPNVKLDTLSLRLTRAFKRNNTDRFFTQLSYNYWNQKNQDDSILYYNFYQDSLFRYAFDESFYSRKDSRIGLRLSYKSAAYTKVKNFNRVKYSEDIDLGYTLSLGYAKNFTPLGASNRDHRFDYDFYYRNIFKKHHFLYGSSETHHYLNNAVLDFHQKNITQYQWRFFEKWSWVWLNVSEFYWRDQGNRQLTIGGFEGFGGVPPFYFSGKALGYSETEIRYFPDLELATIKPVLAGFLSAGNAWDDIYSISTDDIVYNVGLGVRLGATKSTQGIVNHFNISWPLNGPLASGLTGYQITLIAKTSL